MAVSSKVPEKPNAARSRAALHARTIGRDRVLSTYCEVFENHGAVAQAPPLSSTSHYPWGKQGSRGADSCPRVSAYCSFRPVEYDIWCGNQSYSVDLCTASPEVKRAAVG